MVQPSKQNARRNHAFRTGTSNEGTRGGRATRALYESDRSVCRAGGIRQQDGCRLLRRRPENYRAYGRNGERDFLEFQVRPSPSLIGRKRRRVGRGTRGRPNGPKPLTVLSHNRVAFSTLIRSARQGDRRSTEI